MSNVLLYRADFSGRAPIPQPLWILLSVTLIGALLFGGYLAYRQPQVQLLQAQLLSLQLLPSQAQRSAVPDPQLLRQYSEVVKASKELSLPIQAWLTCLQSPPSAPVRINSFDLNSTTEWIELRVTASSHDEARQYLETWQTNDGVCFAAVSQEERNPDGASLLSVKLQPSPAGSQP